MLVLICPNCGAVNPLSEEICLKCETSLTDVLPTDQADDSQKQEESLEILPNEEHDLPGLLQSLKKDGDIDEIEALPHDNVSSGDELDEIFAEDEVEDEEIPDWLEKIRRRAQEEPDAKGDITQKISAALDTIAEDKYETKRDEFHTWLENIRKGEEKSTPAQSTENSSQSEISKSSQNEDSDWLNKIRKAEGKIPENTDEFGRDPSDQKGDSLLQWLIAVEEGREKPSAIKDATPESIDEITEETHPTLHPEQVTVTEPTQKIAVQKEDIIEIERPLVDVSPEEVKQIALFKAIMDHETEKVGSTEAKNQTADWVWRLIIGIVLMASLIVSLLVWDDAVIPENALSPENSAFLSWQEDLEPNASLLLIVNFQPGYSDEIYRVARPVMRIVAEKDPEISLLSITPSGGLLVGGLLAEMDDGGLDYKDLGFIPVSSFAAFGVSSTAQGNPGYLPDISLRLPSEGYDGILIFSDQAEDIQSWVEQLTALSSDSPIFLILAAKAGPMSLPYWESGQVTAMVSGVKESAGLDNAMSEVREPSSGLRAYQIGSVMMMLVILLGLFIKGKRFPGSSREEEK